MEDFERMVLGLSSEIENVVYVLSKGEDLIYDAFSKCSGGSSSGSGSNCGSRSNSGHIKSYED